MSAHAHVACLVMDLSASLFIPSRAKVVRSALRRPSNSTLGTLFLAGRVRGGATICCLLLFLFALLVFALLPFLVRIRLVLPATVVVLHKLLFF